MFSRKLVLAGISTLAVIVSTAAEAQQAANMPEEIVVTAQRRSERLQDVPISITAANPSRLEKMAATNMRDLTVVAPGLRVTGNGANVSPVIRGIRSDQTDPGNDSNVSLYIDGVYQPDQLANSADLADIERVEVLKGPQGTLFGRNATGGAIRVFTRGPSLDQTKGELEVGYGKYNELVANGFLATPLVQDKVAASVSVHFKRSDGYQRDLIRLQRTPDSEEKTVRVKVVGQLSDNFKAEAFASYLNLYDGDATAYTAINGNSFARAFGGPNIIIADEPYETVSEDPITLKANAYQAGLRLTLETDVGEFTSLTAYNAVKSFYSNDADAADTPDGTVDLLSYPIYKRQNNIQQEIVFNSKKFGDFQFTGGGNYYGDTGWYDPLILQGDFIAAPFAFGGFGIPAVYGYFRQTTEAFGIFGEATWTPTDRITILAGVRYSSEDREARGGYFATDSKPTDLSTANLLATAYIPYFGAPTKFKSTTPRASIRYRLNEEGDNVYFTFSQGFKSGGFNVSGLQTTPYRPEKLSAYEIGLKTSPSRVLSANIAAFYYDYTNQQVSANVNNTNITTNAASSRMYGAEAEILARLTDEFTVTAGLAYLNAKFDRYTNAPGLVYTGGRACRCGNTTTVVDVSGGQAPFAPEFTASVVADYTTEISVGVLDLTASLYYNSAFNYDATGRIRQPDYATLDLRASFQPTDSNITVYAWGKNVTSTKYWQNVFISNGSDSVRYAKPATFGGGVKYSF